MKYRLGDLLQDYFGTLSREGSASNLVLIAKKALQWPTLRENRHIHPGISAVVQR